MKITLLLLAVLLVPTAQAQTQPQLDCSRARYCEMREQVTSATGRFAVDDLRNGTLTVRGSNRSDVMVRMRVEIDAHSEREARNMFGLIHTHVTPGRFTADGPSLDNPFDWIFGTGWSVSIEVLVPNKTDLILSTRNGPIFASNIDGRVQLDSRNGAIRLNDVTGNVQFDSRNGAVTLTRVGGSIRGESRNGAINVELAGNSFAGRQLGIESRNGAVTVALPRNYNAHIITETNNGHVNSDFPMSVRGSVGRNNGNDGNREFDLGTGGPTMRITTRNGGIRLRQI